MIAGLATQVLFTAIFCILLTIVCFKIHKQLAEDKKLGYIIGKRHCTIYSLHWLALSRFND